LAFQRLYDLVFLVVPEKDEQETAAIIDEFRKLLVEQGATIDKDESMGRRRLAYTIKKRNEATYYNFLFRADSKAVTEVQRKMRLSESILRFLTVRVDEEMKHGQKVARNTKVRTARPIPGSEGGMSYSPPAPHAPVPHVPEAAMPEAATPEAGKAGE
jgi:small subunit ribosomal protein S6